MGVAYLFAGQGAQTVGMTRDIHDASPAARARWQEAAQVLGYDLARIVFEGPQEPLNQTVHAQPALVVAGVVLFEEAGRRGPLPPMDLACGLSLGEYTALVAAGALSFAAALRIVAARAQLMQRCCESTDGTMASVLGIDAAACEQACRETGGQVVVGNYNSPAQCVLSGERAAVAAASERCKAAGARRIVPLQVVGAYHSPLMAEAARGLEPELRRLELSPPRCEMVPNVDGRPTRDLEQLRACLIRQVDHPVRWDLSMAALAPRGLKQALEFGPGGVLKGLMRQNDREVEVRCIATLEDFHA